MNYEIEFYKSEISKLKLELNEAKNKNMSQNIMDEMKVIIQLASEMRSLLEKCRYEQINMNLAKNIDDVLKRLSYLD